MRSEFTPSTQKGVPVPCTAGVMVMYKIEGAERSEYTDLNQFVQRTRKAAEGGDPHSQMLYGLLIIAILG